MQLLVECKHARVYRRLKECVEKRDVEEGRELVQELITRNGLQSSHIIALLAPLLIRLFVLLGRLQDAHHLFHALAKPKPSSWHAIIHAHSKLGPPATTLSLFHRMLQCHVAPNPHSFAAALKACSSTASLDQGMVIHVHIMDSGFESHIYVGSALINMYVKFVRLDDAQNVFDRFSRKNEFLYTALISGLAQHGQAHTALTVFVQMMQQDLQPSHVTYVCVLKACSMLAAFDLGRLCHAQLVERSYLFMDDEPIGNILIDMYCKCGSLEDAQVIFDTMLNKDVVAWSAIIGGCSVQASQEKVFHLFQQMQQEGIGPGLVALISILSVCFDPQAQAKGKYIHSILVASPDQVDIFIENALVNMYAKCGNIREARRVFNRLQKRDIVIWSTMLEAYAEQGDLEEVFIFFTRMQQDGVEPDKIIFGSVLKVCTKVAAADWGRYLHSLILENGCELEIFLASGVINMYSKCGHVEDAHQVFNKIPKQNIVTWTILLNGYAQLGYFEEALSLYPQMQEDGLVPDHISLVSILKACATKGSVGDGELVHKQIVQHCGDDSLYLVNRLINHYVTFGKLEDAFEMFQRLGTRHVAAWSAMIAGLCQNNYCQAALLLFQQMRQHGLQADTPTYVYVLQSCTKLAALEQGKFVHAQIDHKLCEADCFLGNTLIDMYFKCGCLVNAEIVFNRLAEQDAVVWSSMITGYAENNDYHTALRYFESMQAAGLKPNEITYISLLSACSNRGLLDEGCHHFVCMKSAFNITPTLDHYNCMVDLCGRVGCLMQAKNLLLTMPILPDLVAWVSLLSNCRTHGRVEIGRVCYEQIVKIDKNHASSYELMSKLYIDAGQLDAANEVGERRKRAQAHKKTGMAFIEANNKVSNFLAGSKEHDQYHDISWRLRNVHKHMREIGFIPLVDSVLLPDNINDEVLQYEPSDKLGSYIG